MADAESASNVLGPVEWPAIYFDGQTAKKHLVSLRASACLEISEARALLAGWAYGDIRRADAPRDLLRLRNVAAAPLARLEIRDLAGQAAISQLCPLLDGEGSPGDGATRQIVVWSLAAAVSVFSIIWFGIPLLADRLAPLVPISIEKRLGEASDRQIRAIFGNKTCTRAPGVLALQKLAYALQTQAALPIVPEVQALVSPVPNAFALPGGRVYVLGRLIDKAESPDELAGVLAHEFGHVAHRDSLRRLIADGSTSFLMGLLLGDVTGASVVLTTGKTLFSAAYSRDAESAADLYAQGLMQKLGRSPKALATLMLKISGSERQNPLALFASHPMTADRIAALSQFMDEPVGPELLTDEEWRDLKTICK